MSIEAFNRWGFTGSRHRMTEAQAEMVRGLLRLAVSRDGRPAELHHGDCMGADARAHLIAQGLDMRIIGHPPDIDRYRARCKGFAEQRDPLPYLVRNHNIVDETEVLIATPDGPESLRSGTWATVRYARQLGRPIYIIGPEGEWRREPELVEDLTTHD